MKTTKGERREEKSRRRWYKKYLHNNRKAIALIQEQSWKRQYGRLKEKTKQR